MFIGRTDAEAETPILWPSDAKSQKNPRRVRKNLEESEKTFEKTLMLGKIEGRRRRG